MRLPSFGHGSNRLNLGLIFILTAKFNEHTFWVLKVEKLGNKHHRFQKLLIELNKHTEAYELLSPTSSMEKRNLNFFQVSFTGLPHLSSASWALCPQWQNGRKWGTIRVWLTHMGSIYSGCVRPHHHSFAHWSDNSPVKCGFRDDFMTKEEVE